MRITIHETLVAAAGITDLRPVGVLAPVRPSATRLRHSVSRSAGPVLRRRPLIVPSLPRVAAAADTLVLTGARPPYRGAGGGPRARPATTLV